MKILTLHVKSEYFEEIKSGVKTEEYRLSNKYWDVRFVDKFYDEVHILCGYPRRGDHEKRLVFPWGGWSVKQITHPHFGGQPVTVYAVNLQGRKG